MVGLETLLYCYMALYLFYNLQLCSCLWPHYREGLQQPEPCDLHDWGVGSHELGLRNGHGSNGELLVTVYHRYQTICLSSVDFPVLLLLLLLCFYFPPDSLEPGLSCDHG